MICYSDRQHQSHGRWWSVMNTKYRKTKYKIPKNKYNIPKDHIQNTSRSNNERSNTKYRQITYKLTRDQIQHTRYKIPKYPIQHTERSNANYHKVKCKMPKDQIPKDQTQNANREYKITQIKYQKTKYQIPKAQIPKDHHTFSCSVFTFRVWLPQCYYPLSMVFPMLEFALDMMCGAGC